MQIIQSSLFSCKKLDSELWFIMIMQRKKWSLNLRLQCLIIGYMNLLASIIDIGIHVAIVGIITKGFQCDATEESLKNIDWPWLEPFLLLLNLGTHGFYPFPLILRNRNNLFFDYQILTTEPRCYFGMFHVNMIDILNFLINIIWLKFVRAYVVAVHKVRAEKKQKVDQPPSYIECLVSMPNNQEKAEKKDAELFVAEETKKNIESISETV
ncbi:unnamed protein product [Diatraea saccharalis]|uniref:Uncharacterized protein n=1 Tax=Diatraea saccharalis TaxID=40085 RepID=A0A9N9RBQ3_9NEOP|nr:unnamed protein product [Diatraea saccharalis]